MNVLHLPIKRKWFDMIHTGEKLEEYREIKPYWARRLLDFEREMESQVMDEMICDMRAPLKNHASVNDLLYYFGVRFRRLDYIIFKNGYAKNAPTLRVPLDHITISVGKLIWGAEHHKYYFVLRFGKTNPLR